MHFATWHPLTNWPGSRSKPRRSPFSAPPQKTLDLLKRELAAIGATEVTIYADFRPSQIRRDGWPRMGETAHSNGVILEFKLPGGLKVTYPCDAFDDCTDNLRAIALSLEALRAVDRYGVTKRGEQYKGFAALPPPIVTEAPMTIDQAKEFVRGLANKTIPHPDVWLDWDHVYRWAVKVAHPDRGGDTKQFQRLQDAMYIIKADEAAAVEAPANG